MGEKLKQSDIAQDDLFGQVIKSAKELTTQLDTVNKEINETVVGLSKLAKTASTDTQKGINQVTKARGEMNAEFKKAQIIEKETIKNSKTLQKARLEEIRVQKAREDAVDKFNKKEAKAASDSERRVKKGIKDKEKARLDEIKLQKAREKSIDDFNKKEVKSVKDAQRATTKLTQEKEKAAKQAQKAKRATLDGANAYKILSKNVNSASARLKRMSAQYGATDKRTIRAQRNFDRLEKKLRGVNNAARDGRRDVGRYGLALNNVRGSALRLAAGLGLAGGGFALLRGGFKTISDFDTVIASLGSITGKTGKGLEDLKDKVLQVSNETGKGATEIAEAMKLVGSAQPELLKNADGLAEVTKQAVLLAQAGGIDVPIAAAALTKSMNQFGVSADQAANFTDILATSQQKGTATIEQISEAMKNAGSVAKASGLDFQQTNAILQALAKGGLVGAEAGTKLRSILLKLAKTGREDLNPATQNFSDILNVLKKEVTNVTEAQALFGDENAAAALTLIDQKDVVKELDGALLDHGNATEQAAQNMDTLAGQSERAVTALKNYILGSEGATSFSNGLKEALKFLAENLSTIVGVLVQVIKFYALYRAALIALKIQKHIKDINAHSKALKKSGVETKKLSKSATKFKGALKSIGWAAAIGLAIEFANALIDVATGADVAERELASFQARQEGFQKNTDKNIKGLNDLIDAEKNRLELAIASGDLSEEQAAKQFQAFIKLDKASKDLVGFEEFDPISGKVVDSFVDLEARVASLIEEEKKRITISKSGIRQFEADGKFKNRLLIAEEKATIRLSKESLKSLREFRGELKNEQFQSEVSTKSFEKFSREIGKGNDERGKQVSLLRKIEDEQIKQIQNEKDLATIKAGTDAQRSIEDINVNADAQERADLTFEIQQNLLLELTRIDKEFFDQAAEIAREAEEKAQAAREAAAAKRIAEAKEFQENLLKAKKLILLKSNATEEEINKEFLEAEIELLQLRTQLTLDEQISLEEKKRQLKNLELAEEKAHQDELLSIRKKVFEKLDELAQKALDKQIEDSQKKQELLEKEISNSQKLEDRLRDSAANQNAVATESLAAQSDITEQKEREKIKEAQKQERIEELKALWQTLNTFLSQGDNPLIAGGKAVGVVASMKALFGNITGFAKGTKGRLGDEHTAQASGVDGHVVRVDSSEAILTGKKMDRLAAAGLYTTDDIVNSAIMKQQLVGVPMANAIDDRVVSSTDTSVMEGKLDAILAATKRNKPAQESPILRQGKLDGIVYAQEMNGKVTRNWMYKR